MKRCIDLNLTEYLYSDQKWTYGSSDYNNLSAAVFAKVGCTKYKMQGCQLSWHVKIFFDEDAPLLEWMYFN